MSTIKYGVKGHLPHWLPDTAVSVFVWEREREKEWGREKERAHMPQTLQKKENRSTVPNTLRVLFFCSFHMKLDSFKALSMPSQSIVISLRVHHKWAFFTAAFHNVDTSSKNECSSEWFNKWKMNWSPKEMYFLLCHLVLKHTSVHCGQSSILTTELQEGFSSDDSSMTAIFAYLCRCNWTVGHCTITPVCQIILNVFCSQTGALACLSDNSTSNSRWYFA